LVDQVGEVLDALAGAEVDAEARPVDAVVAEDAGVGQGLLAGGGGEGAVDAGMLPALAVGHEVRQVEVLDLPGGRGPEGGGVGAEAGPDAALAGQLRLEHLADAVAQRRDRPHAGDDDATFHGSCSESRKRLMTRTSSRRPRHTAPSA